MCMRVYYFRCYWPSNLLSLRCQMCDPHFKFEKDRKKTVSLSWTIGISDRRTDTQTDRETYIHSSDIHSKAPQRARTTHSVSVKTHASVPHRPCCLCLDCGFVSHKNCHKVKTETNLMQLVAVSVG